MLLFKLCKTPAGAVRVTRTQLVLYVFLLLSLILYFCLHGRRASEKLPHSLFHSMKKAAGWDDLETIKAGVLTRLETPWGAPLVWGDTQTSAQHRKKIAQQGIRTGLLALVVGTYARFVRRFLSSAETHFLPSQMVTYYILTDNPHSLDPPLELGLNRQLKVVPVAELPGWDRLAYRRMALLADAIRDSIGNEVEFIFCADIDQVFVAPVREEIFGDLVATLHPELYEKPRSTFPYQVEEDSSALVREDEGDYYYTSEFYGGLVSEMYGLARACSLLLLQDQANGVTASRLEESYLNRYLINHRPTCVLSPEYSWWNSDLVVDVPVKRLISLGRQCEALDAENRAKHRC